MQELWKNGPLFTPDSAFPVGGDSVLLSDFSQRPGAVRCAELCCGAGLISLLLCLGNERLSAVGLEIDVQAAELARRNMADNGLASRCAIITGDIRRHRELLAPGGFDLILCNPPYFPRGSGRASPDPRRAAARGEELCTLDDVCAAAAWALRSGGAFCLVHRAQRLSQLLCAMTAAGMEPKRLRMVQHLSDSAPSLVLAEGRRGGRPGLSVEAPLILCQPDGSDSPEVRRIYHLE